ncbi:hypothetical protein BH10CHL1_BH10CHL1_01570 [soil metagenome]
MNTHLCINLKARYVLIWHGDRRTTAQFWIGHYSWWRLMRILDSTCWRQVAIVGDEHWLVREVG